MTHTTKHLLIPHHPVKGSQGHWMRLLQSIPALKCLRIISKMMGSSLQVFEMLQYCPKLVQLDITLDNGSSVTFNMYHNHGYPALRHLHASYEAANSAIVPRIIQHFTCLDVLRLTTPMISYEDLSKVSQLCPQLQRLLLGNRNGTPHTENALLQQGDSRGIRLLFIQSSLFHGDCIARFLKEHATRLESVEVLLSASSISYISSLLHEPVVLDRLRSLR